MNGAALPAVLDDPVSTKDREVLGDGRRIETHDLGEPSSRTLPLHQPVDDHQPGLVGEGLQHTSLITIGQAIAPGCIWVRQRFPLPRVLAPQVWPSWATSQGYRRNHLTAWPHAPYFPAFGKELIEQNIIRPEEHDDRPAPEYKQTGHQTSSHRRSWRACSAR